MFEMDNVKFTHEQKSFIKHYVSELKQGNASVFIGAGFSQESGYVNWRQLLEDIAIELKLDIEKEYDLISIAQYYVNTYGNRNLLNQCLVNEFTRNLKCKEKHYILARLPLYSYWTTNYDSLIENSLERVHKIADVKFLNNQLSTVMPDRDAVVYKMHGDSKNLSECILTKDDYERYHKTHRPFLTFLKGELISKSFLFLGFSFNDPNLNYILSRIYVDYDENAKQHFAIIKEPTIDDYRKEDSESKKEEKLKYDSHKFLLFIRDLERYHIKVIKIKNYKEIDDILREIEHKIISKNVFISGSVAEFVDNWNAVLANLFISKLSERLISEGYNIISGFGLGVGSQVVFGALHEIYINQKKSLKNNRLILRPFPYDMKEGSERIELWKNYREDMISYAGSAIFLFGNKRGANGTIITADGVKSEFSIAQKKGCFVLPIPCTGGAAKEIYDEIDESYIDKSNEIMQKIPINENEVYILVDEIIHILNDNV